MARFDHPILQEVAELSMPHPEEVIINHGAALVIQGIRSEHEDGDVDIATSLENITYLRELLGWRAVRIIVGYSKEGKERTIGATRDDADRYDVHRWDFSMQRYNRTGKGRIYLPEQRSMSEQDELTGMWVASPQLVALTKRETGRQKDQDDLAAIEAFEQR